MTKVTIHPDIMDLCYARKLALHDIKRIIEEYYSGLNDATVVPIEEACYHMHVASEAIGKAISELDKVNNLNYERG